MIRVGVALVLLAIGGSASPVVAQEACPPLAAPAAGSPLPAPTGPLKVGRRALHVPGSPELMLHFWYPAEPVGSAAPAPYLHGWPSAREKLTEPARRLFRDAFCAFDQGRVYSTAVNDAPVATRDRRYPLLVFSPGLGIPSFAYAAQLDDLASHGYVVAAVEYAPTAAFVLFPDGRVERMDAAKWDAVGKLPFDAPETRDFERTEIAAGAAAVRSALDALTRLDRSHPLAGRLDFDRTGVFGHSVGGMFATRAAQTDRRFRAALSEDAIGPGVLSFAEQDGRTTAARVALFFRPVPQSQRTNVPKLLASYPAGTLLAAPVAGTAFSHMSFSDVLLIRAADPAERERQLRNLALVRSVTRTFFDETLRGRTVPTASVTAQFPEISVEVSK